MIAGIGLDIVEISRIRRSLERQRFAQRVYSESERAYLSTKADAAQSAAGMFAAKEAVLKSMGKGLGSIPLGAISIEHDAQGAPFVSMPLEKGRIVLSITHAGDTAAAVAVWEI